MQLREKGAELSTAFDAKEHFILGDTIHLTGALCNLLDNANKYTSDHPKISISTYNNKNNIVVTVADNGLGIHKDKQGKIFDKFYRIYNEAGDNPGGYGLGLAYVKKIIDAHHGTIRVTSNEHGGTCFEITLPIFTSL